MSLLVVIGDVLALAAGIYLEKKFGIYDKAVAVYSWAKAKFS